MRECFAAFGASYEPKFAFVIVTKRIGTRFMQDLGRTVENPPPGTLVNYGCTGDDMYEYFIVAQAVRQGTPSCVRERGLRKGRGRERRGPMGAQGTGPWTRSLTRRRFVGSIPLGSVTPTQYHVVYDTSGLQAIHLQALTFKASARPGTRHPEPMSCAFSY